MLSNEETNDLVTQAKNGDDLAKEKLITVNSPLIKSVIKRYLNKGIEYDDLFQLGALGFVKAIKNYDSSFNVKFTTYAVPMIAGEIKRFLRDDGTVKVSRSIKHQSIQIKNFIVEYNQRHGTNPTLDQISQKFNMDKSDIVFAMEANTNPLSLNDKFEDDNSCTLMDKISDDFSPEKYIDKLAIRELIENLSAREKQVIIMRYYMDKTQSEIAKALGVSQVQVSRIENKVLKEMKENINI
ncbi:MAG TPA: SigB/SigF/SigG family RNA polymerase sigma factor [Candidatus Onthoplasma faecipullorum]|nr:SigB/SigF/SigG family RNA polymerase sigma factor [Candidatus Onthoplasma faecipullorum]